MTRLPSSYRRAGPFRDGDTAVAFFGIAPRRQHGPVIERYGRNAAVAGMKADDRATFPIMEFIMTTQSEMLSAANQYQSEHGHDALTTLLRNTVCVDRIVDVEPEDRHVVYLALMNGRIMAAVKRATKKSTPTLDSRSVYDKWNRRQPRDDDFEGGAEAVWRRWRGEKPNA